MPVCAVLPAPIRAYHQRSRGKPPGAEAPFIHPGAEDGTQGVMRGTLLCERFLVEVAISFVLFVSGR